MKSYYIYILTNQRRGTLYVGVTGNLAKRTQLHKQKKHQSFSQKYQLNTLVYFEKYTCVTDALKREKQLKRWHRSWKIDLIEQHNPSWQDLYTFNMLPLE